jgi:hypothetical protein
MRYLATSHLPDDPRWKYGEFFGRVQLEADSLEEARNIVSLNFVQAASFVPGSTTLHSPFSAPELVEIAEIVAPEPDVPVITSNPDR